MKPVAGDAREGIGAAVSGVPGATGQRCRVHLRGNALAHAGKSGRRVSAMPNSTFIVRQVWIAASLQTGRRPRLPVGAASQVTAGSNPIVNDPRRFSAALWLGQFRAL